jgi:hypothetical protein
VWSPVRAPPPDRQNAWQVQECPPGVIGVADEVIQFELFDGGHYAVEYR